MILRKTSFIATVLLFCSLSILAQKKDSVNVCEAKGFVKDQANNYFIQSATVAIYKGGTSNLLGYTLTDSFGSFSIKNLPYGVPLIVVVTYTGYNSYQKKIQIFEESKLFDLKELNLEKKGDNIQVLDEVTINAKAPVSLKGDTLEFNADAFHLAPNAVVEDLMKKLPGIVIWSDGLITINGKKVQRLFVEGKPFFGGKSKTAMQNLPKNSVDRIQVYNTSADNHSIDSILNVNIKLKENKKTGIFGKVSIGLGTRGRSDLGGMINWFDSNTQIGIIGAANNSNNVPKNVNSLIQNNSFKGVGVSIEYQPDFNMPGISRSQALGLTFQHDFIENPTSFKNNRINADYFSSKINKDILSRIQTNFVNGTGKNIIQNAECKNESYSLKQDFDGTYSNKNKNFDFYITPNIFYLDEMNSNDSNTGTETDAEIPLSRNKSLDINNFKHKKALFKSGFKTRKTKNSIWDFIEFDYILDSEITTGDRKMLSEFESFEDSTNLKMFDRKYQSQTEKLSNSVFLNYRKLQDLLLKNISIWNINIGFRNNLTFNEEINSSKVFDRTSSDTNEEYLANDYLTNKNRYSFLDYISSIDLSKTFAKAFSDRYRKTTEATINLQTQYYAQKNNSEHQFQNLQRSYREFVPGFKFSFEHHKHGSFNKVYVFDFKSKVDFPSIDQLAPLTDSSSAYLLRKANPGLKRQYAQTISFTYKMSSEKVNNNLLYEIGFSAGRTEDMIVDSITYDKIGRRSIAAANADGHKYFRGNALVQRSHKIAKTSILQLTLAFSLELSKSPNYINENLNTSQNFSNYNNINVYYEWTDILAVNFQQSYSILTSTLSNGIALKNKSLRTIMSTSVNLPRETTVSSNINFVTNKNNMSMPNNLIIWNANFSARFFKGNNLEVKFSALDLLRQNKSVVNYIDGNTITTGIANVLQNYFMLTFSYYPRIFRNKKQQK